MVDVAIEVVDVGMLDTPHDAHAEPASVHWGMRSMPIPITRFSAHRDILLIPFFPSLLTRTTPE